MESIVGGSGGVHPQEILEALIMGPQKADISNKEYIYQKNK